jgi:hypothetical protein
MALECFRILHKLSPPCLNDIPVLKNSKHSLRYSNVVEIPRVKTTTYGKISFKYFGFLTVIYFCVVYVIQKCTSACVGLLF